MQTEAIKQLIESGIPDAQITITGDGSHFDAVVVSEAFQGKSMVQQHQLVYATLGGRMESGEIHALALKTFTPEQWRAQPVSP